MTGIDLEIEKAALAREILNSDSEELLLAVKKTIQQVKARLIHEDSETFCVHSSVEEGLREIQQIRQGVLKSISVEELLDEL